MKLAMTSQKVSIALQPLDSSEFISTLRSFKGLLLSCVGPEGGIKILISGGGYTTYTSSSTRLLNNITISNPICLFISQIMKSQMNAYHDHGLYTGILITSLLESILSHQIGLPVSAISNVFENLKDILTNLFEMNCIKLQVDFSTVQQLLPLVQSIISSKPACGLTKTAIQNLQLNIVKGFLQTFDKTMGDVLVECTESSEIESRVVPGVLYHINYDDISKILNEKSNKEGTMSLMLFNIMLTGEDDKKTSENRSIRLEGNKRNETFMVEALSLFQQIEKLNVDIVACQKVVHPSLCLYLQRRGILLLDRMGTVLTQAVEKLTGATPISSIRHCPQDTDGLRKMCGAVDSIKLERCGQRNYVLFEKAGSKVATLIVPAPNEEAATELKVVIKQSLSALRSLMMHPALTPGAGCLEMSLAVRLQHQAMGDSDKYDCTVSQLSSCISWLQKALLAAAGLTAGFSLLTVDSVFGHLWKVDKERCCCGLVFANMVCEKSGRWTEVSNNQGALFLQNTTFLSSLSSDPLTLIENVVVDLHRSKQNAVMVSVESCLNLLGIGMIVYKSDNE
ncbi:molecular chaperone MKKS-like [Periplaneta americana]|uniref:molecular chaperone MKKS-like n=1 Tax=Periplaneta americana TaxID=6978 RepID=UPI0037E9BE43